MRCEKCNNDNPADASFCESCGSKLELTCPACKTALSPGARFCKKCETATGVTTPAQTSATSKESPGTSGKPADAPIRVADTPASENLAGERTTVTALVADIKGSTEMMEDLDPKQARAMFAAIYNRFTEGFDTADLKDAKALLDELGGTSNDGAGHI